KSLKIRFHDAQAQVQWSDGPNPITTERRRFHRLGPYCRLVTQFELIRGGVDRANCRRCRRRSRSATPTVSLRMASPRLPQHWAVSTGPPQEHTATRVD